MRSAAEAIHFKARVNYTFDPGGGGGHANVLVQHVLNTHGYQPVFDGHEQTVGKLVPALLRLVSGHHHR